MSEATAEAAPSRGVLLPPSSKAMAGLCDRLSVSLDAGIDLRRVVRGEAARTSGALKTALSDVAQRIDRGESMVDAMLPHRGVFPSLFIEMTRVAEATGSAPKIYRQLAQHYEHRARVQRGLLAGIAWPAIQLAIALLVVGILIYVSGVVGGPRGGVDLLGFGLTGAAGLATYVNVLLAIAIAALIAFAIVRRRPDLQAAMFERLAALPVVGPSLDKVALAQIAWRLHLTMNVDLDLRRVAALALDASGSRKFSRHRAAVADAVGAGRPLSEAFAQTGAFPQPFVDALHVAEESGRISESMEKLSAQYEEEADRAIATLATIVGAAVWLLVAALVIALIFRIFGFYVGAINDAAQGL